MTGRLWLGAGALLVAAAAFGGPVEEGFEHFYNLEYDEALAKFRRAIAADPANPRLYNHVAQTVLYRELYRVGALESELVSGTNPFLRRPKVNPTPEDEKQFDDAIAAAMSLANERLAEKPEDPTTLYSLGVSYGLRANYNFLIRKAWMDALRDATTARKLHDRVVRIDPSFIDARLIPAVHDYVVGSLPWHWKVLGFLVGFRGDKERGIATLELIAQRGSLNREDAKILLCAVYRREREPARAVAHLTDLIPRFPRNYILRFELVQMYSDLGKKEEALAVLREMEQLKRAGAPGYARLAWEKIWFSRGTLLFWYRDFDQAVADFQKVTARPHAVDLNTEVQAWLRLGQTYDLIGQRSQAVRAYQQAIRTAPESDQAREARRYLQEPYRRKDVG
jgi:tetratricopeptide (TPR) repeat protein